MKRKAFGLIIHLLLVFSVIFPCVIIGYAASGTITFNDGRVFANFKDAFDAVVDGDDITMTIHGDEILASAAAENIATLSKEAKVTILSEGDTTINGLIGINSNGTLVVGNGSSNNIHIVGGLFADQGILETHSELSITSTERAGSGAMRIGSEGSSATIIGRIDGGLITTGSSITSAQSGIKIDGNGTYVEYIKGVTIHSTADRLEEGAIAIASGARVGSIENCVVTSANNYIIALGNYRSAAHIDTIKDCNFKSSSYGIIVYANSTIGDIKKTAIETEYSSGTSVAISVQGSINSISEGSTIKVTASDAIGISSNGGSIHTIDHVQLSMIGKKGAFGVSLQNAFIDTILNCSIQASSSGRLYGVNMQPARINYIKDTEINIEQKGSGSTFIAYQVGPIKEISGCTMRAMGSYPTSCGWNVLNDPLFASSDYKPRLDIMKDTKISAGAYALAVQQDGELGVLSGNHFYASHSNYGSIYLSVGGVIEEIKSGTYASKGNGVIINYGTRPGPQRVYNSTLKKISYEEKDVNGQIVKEGPIFYGETGWAINANTQGPAPTIEIEKEQVEIDQPIIGYARYFGGASKTGGLGNGDALIGKDTTDRAIDRDNYPMYHDTAATGTADDPSDYLYFMSKKNTDNNVKDDVLKNFASVDISGKTFHYLTVNARLVYHPNDEKGTPKVIDKTAMDDETFRDEYNTAREVAANKYTREEYSFIGWNTKADGSGKTYQAGDTLRITEPKTTLYAQWKPQYTITYKLNGGEYNGDTADIKEVYDENTWIKIHAAPTRIGYKFLYWEGSSYQPNDDYKVTEDHTFVAKWENAPSDKPTIQPTNPRYSTPQTGDNHQILLHGMIFCISSLSIVILIALQLKKRVSD